MRTPWRWLLTLALLATSAIGCAQSSAPAEPANNTPQVSFELDWPVATPPRSTIVMDAAGRATYTSQMQTTPGEQQAEPYVFHFTASPHTSARAFELASQLNYFQGSFDNLGKKVAQTGRKTLCYTANGAGHCTVYNASTNPKLVELTGLFQNMATTFELSRQLAIKHRFDKLGLDALLTRMEELQQSGLLAELQAVAPTLEEIANDPAVMSVARQRARHLLSEGAQAAK